jgi:hypothetical protein
LGGALDGRRDVGDQTHRSARTEINTSVPN